MSYIKGDILMFDIGNKDADILRALNYTPYIFDNHKRVLFLVDSRGIKLYKKIKKYKERKKNEE